MAHMEDNKWYTVKISPDYWQIDMARDMPLPALQFFFVNPPCAYISVSVATGMTCILLMHLFV